MHTHTHTHIQAYTHTYIYTHIHTHTHILYIFVHRRPLLSPLSADNDTLRQADVSGKTLRTTAIKAEISNTMRTISTLSVVRVNTRKRSSSAKANRERSKRGSARIAKSPKVRKQENKSAAAQKTTEMTRNTMTITTLKKRLRKNTVMTASKVRGYEDDKTIFI